MAKGYDMQTVLNTLATVSEDLAIELLSSYTEDNLGELVKVIQHLTQASEVLTHNDIEAPYAVTSIIHHYNVHAAKAGFQQ